MKENPGGTLHLLHSTAVRDGEEVDRSSRLTPTLLVPLLVQRLHLLVQRLPLLVASEAAGPALLTGN